MKSRDELDVTAQVRFDENGEMEVDKEVGTDLSDWGVVEETEQRESRIEEEAASEFGVDDRSEVVEASDDRQVQLFIRTAEGQHTLEGTEHKAESRF